MTICFQAVGNRYYLGDELKMKMGVIKDLIRMNETYPTCTEDYDLNFLKLLLTNVFEKPDLLECGKSGYISGLNRAILAFAKSKFVARS